MEAGAVVGAEAAADGIEAFSDEDAWDVMEEIPNGCAAALLLSSTTGRCRFGTP